MANLLTVDELIDYLPGISITDDTVPNTTQSEHIIGNVESDLRALLAGYGASWPTSSNTDAASFMRQTLVEGVKEQVLRAKYALTRGDLVPDELDRAAEAYKARKQELRTIAGTMRDSAPTAATGAQVPTVANFADMPRLSGSFDAYTNARDVADQARSPYWPVVRPS